MSAIVVFQGHPDPSGDRLCHALSSAYSEAAKAAGHAVTHIDLSQFEFPVLRKQADWKSGVEGTPDSLRPAQQAVTAADHVALIFPLWFGTVPAYTKAAIEQIFRPDVALAYGGGFPKPLMKGKTVRLIVTMSTPSWAYRYFYRQPAISVLKRHIFGFAGFKPVKSTVFGGVDHAPKDRVEGWLDHVRALGASDAG